jgi:hypothetical protein
LVAGHLYVSYAIGNPVPTKQILNRFFELLILGRPTELKSAREIIGWWEIQRITYNLVLGIVGLVSALVVICISIASYEIYKSDFGMPDPPLFALIGVIIYGFLANVFYTGGWVLELLVHVIWPNQSNNFGNRAYFYGFIFSIILTISPAVLLTFFGLVKLGVKLLS